jgi:TRAP-type mannitol/chloroaromatic compound transport system permease small subunit
MYGTLFMMGGAYTLSKNGHVRGDFIYRTWKPTTQAKVDLTLYILFFFPGVTALILSGWKYASRSWGYGEVSVNSPAGIPIYQFKMVMVAAGILLLIQGIAQVMRCIYCIKNGDWLNAEDDIEETEVILMRAAENSEDLSSIKDR